VKKKVSMASFLVALILGTTSLSPAIACTDFLVTTTDGTKIVGRSMEWG
jgi:penicillin V acylase-like amidase (Ntn superfamily)